MTIIVTGTIDLDPAKALASDVTPAQVRPPWVPRAGEVGPPPPCGRSRP